MKDFVRLFGRLDGTTRSTEKVAALEAYFLRADAGDAAWALHFLLGRRGRRPVRSSLLRHWAAEASGYPPWLVEECYDAVGDLAETLALLLRRSPAKETAGVGEERALSLRALVEERLLPLASLPAHGQRALLLGTLASLDRTGRLLYLKLLTGGFRLGVSRGLLARALAALAGVDRAVMEHRLVGDWRPVAEDYRRLLAAGASRRDPAQPYPFFLASPLEPAAEPLADPAEWQVEWKWDGIRAQLIRREGQTVLWSRGEEVITPGYPEIAEAAAFLPGGTVLDGELLAWRNGRPLAFGELQKRLGRRNAGARVRREVPVIFMAYDVLERGGADVRGEPLARRRAFLEEVIACAAGRAGAQPAREAGRAQGELFPAGAWREEGEEADDGFAIRLSPVLAADGREELAARRAEARARGAEGIMLKRRSSPYGTGRKRGAWWKWKVDPFTVDAVLLAAQPGHGRRAGLFTDYTFGIWRGGELVSFAKAYAGLSDAEIREVDRWVRAHTTGRHGPVRAVEPALVFELAFEGIRESARHKSGLALRFPRIARWRRDKRAEAADRIETVRELMEAP